MTLTIIPGRGPCLRCLWPEPAGRADLPNCVTAGVINTVPVLVAALQATEALKLLSGGGAPITDFRVIDPWTGTFQSFKVARNPECPACGKKGAGS